MWFRRGTREVEEISPPAGFGLAPKVIGRTDSPVPYMLRWRVFRLFGFTVKFHVFMRSDAACLHDHPWSYMSIMLAGSYREVTDSGTRKYSAPAVLFRRAKHRHRVEIDAPCLTLNVSGPGVRRWGFWTPAGFVGWRDYDEAEHECE